MPRGGARPGAGRKRKTEKRGAPTLYKPEYAEQAKKLCELGATDQELAEFFCVNRVTIHRWRCTQFEFSNAVKVAKEAADDRVERSLYQRAVGYSHEAVKIFANPRTGENVVVPYVEHYPPDTAAAFIWLKNRRKEKWRDKQEVEHSGSLEVKDVSPRERIASRIAGLAERSTTEGDPSRILQ